MINNYNVISVSLYDRIVRRSSVARQFFPSRLLLSPSSPEQQPGNYVLTHNKPNYTLIRILYMVFIGY